MNEDVIITFCVHVSHGCVTMAVDNIGNDIIDDVIMFKGRSKVYNAVTSLMFKLEHQQNTQDVGYLIGHDPAIFTFR